MLLWLQMSFRRLLVDFPRGLVACFKSSAPLWMDRPVIQHCIAVVRSLYLSQGANSLSYNNYALFWTNVWNTVFCTTSSKLHVLHFSVCVPKLFFCVSLLVCCSVGCSMNQWCFYSERAPLAWSVALLFSARWFVQIFVGLRLIFSQMGTVWSLPPVLERVCLLESVSEPCLQMKACAPCSRRLGQGT